MLQLEFHDHLLDKKGSLFVSGQKMSLQLGIL